jgi:abortive infection bacteriophage resistance protein
MSRAFTKPSLRIEQQITHLKEGGMSVPDEDVARYWLRHVSYYRLSAYWLHFEHPKNCIGPRFKPGTSFTRVTDLYDFDRVLRRLVMRGTEHVEVALRGNWAYQLAQIDNGHKYLDASLYRNRKEFHDNLSKLAADVGKSSETYIKHYRDSYDTPALPPVWMVAEMMSFGQLSRWYSNIEDRSLRNRIAEPLGLPETVLVPLVRHITHIRNICAHHGRLWNRGFRLPPKLAEKPDDLSQSLDHRANQAGLRLYNGLTMVAHVVRTVAPQSSWGIDLRNHLTTHPEQTLSDMGFPDDWEQRPLWKWA